LGGTVRLRFTDVTFMVSTAPFGIE